MSNEIGWAAAASLNGSIQSLHEQVALLRTRAEESESRELVLQQKLDSINSVTSYVFASQALAINTPLVKFAAAVGRIISGAVF